jgi:pyruvate-ferredoxin/flavodoxin oxidoreductase
MEQVKAFREHALTPDKPSIRGTAQNPDVFFQAREACNPFYDAVPGKVQEMMDRADASAYDPNTYSEAVKHESRHADKMSPLDLVEASKTLAEQLLSMPQEQRESEYRRLKNLNPVMAALVKAAVEEYRRATGQWGKDAA